MYYKYDPETGVITWVDENDKPSVLTSDSSGKFIIRGLENGPYTLIETKAPNGYQLPGNNVVFTVTNGMIASVSGGAEHDGTALTVSNFTGTELPETGGPGTTILTIGGLLLMAGAVGGGYGLRRRRGKEGR